MGHDATAEELLTATIRALWVQRLGRNRGMSRTDTLQVAYVSSEIRAFLLTLPGYQITSTREAAGAPLKAQPREIAAALADELGGLAPAWIEGLGKDRRSVVAGQLAALRDWSLWGIGRARIYADSQAAAQAAAQAWDAQDSIGPVIGNRGGDSIGPVIGNREGGSIGPVIGNRKGGLERISGKPNKINGSQLPDQLKQPSAPPLSSPAAPQPMPTLAEVPLALVALVRAPADKSSEGVYEEFGAFELQIGVEGLLAEVVEEAVSFPLSDDQEAVLGELRALYQATDEITLRGFDERYTKRAINGALEQVFSKAEARDWTVRVERVEAGFSVFVLNQPMPENWLVDAMRRDREWAERRLAESNRLAQQVKAPRGRPLPPHATER